MIKQTNQNTEQKKKLPLSSDIVFKRVFSTEDKTATKGIEIHIIELPKFIQKNPDANTKLEQWLWLIAGREDKIKMAEKENEELKKAIEIIDQMSMDEKEWEMYLSREKAIINYNSGLSRAKLDGIQEGIEQGIEKGIEKKSKEMVAQMLKMNMDDETICKIAQIDQEKLEKLKEEIKSEASENT